MAVSGQLRARNAPGEGERSPRLHVDELYAEYALTPEHFLHAGRRHLVHGRSLGVNPLDIAVDPLDLDRSKDTDRRRNEIEGQDMLGFESLLGERFTLAGYWTPGERALLAGTFHPAGVEVRPHGPRVRRRASRRWALLLTHPGRSRAPVRRRGGPPGPGPAGDPGRPPARADPGAFLAEAGERRRFFPRSSLGASYTLESGASVNLEHYFDANGYTSGEWDEITGLIAENGRESQSRAVRRSSRRKPSAA